MPFVFSSLAALCFTAGGVFMKHADGLRNLSPSMAFVLLFVLGAAFQSYAIRGAELGSAYVLILGLEAIFAFAFGMFFFGEALTLVKAGAVILVLSGIALLRAG